MFKEFLRHFSTALLSMFKITSRNIKRRREYNYDIRGYFTKIEQDFNLSFQKIKSEYEGKRD